MKPFFIGLAFLLISSMTFAMEYRANGVGGDLKSSQTTLKVGDDIYTLLAFSYIEKKPENTSISADYTVLIGEINGVKVTPIKVSEDYRNHSLIIKVFKSQNIFDESTLVAQSEEIFLDESYEHFNIEMN